MDNKLSIFRICTVLDLKLFNLHFDIWHVYVGSNLPETHRFELIKTLF